MSDELNRILAAAPVVPLVQADRPEVAVRTAEALLAGGLKVIEVVLRSDTALDCLHAIAAQLPQAIAGAGTVLSVAQAEAALEAGARFVVSPGLDDDVVGTAKERDVPVYPGIYTPSELQHAANLGLDTVKFFPASIAGGIPALKAYSSVFRMMKFMPTGGVSADNLADFLSVPSVLACGGSWLTPVSAIDKGDFDTVTSLAREAVEIAAKVRGAQNL